MQFKVVLNKRHSTASIQIQTDDEDLYIQADKLAPYLTRSSYVISTLFLIDY